MERSVGFGGGGGGGLLERIQTAVAEVLLVAERAWEESSSKQRQLYSQLERETRLSLLLIVDLDRSTISRRSIGAHATMIDRGVNFLTLNHDHPTLIGLVGEMDFLILILGCI